MNEANIERRIMTVCLVFMSFFCLGFCLFWLKSVLVPFVLAVFFSYCILPVVDVMRVQLRVNRWGAVFATLVLGIAVMTFLGFLISASVTEVVAKIDIYEAEFKKLTDMVLGYLPEDFNTVEKLQKAFGDNKSSGAQNNFLAQQIKGYSGGFFNLLGNGFLVLVFVAFLVIGRSDGVKSKGTIVGEIETSIKSYIVKKVSVSIATGFLHGMVLFVLGVPYAYIFGLLAVILNFIPNIGPIIAVLLPLPIVALDPSMALYVSIGAVVLPGVIHFLSGNVLEPRMMGQSLDLHPIVILIALIFWGMLWDMAGMFLATPITAVAKVILNKIEITRPFAEILAGRFDALEEEAKKLSNTQAVERDHIATTSE